VIGRGASATVYRARQEGFDRLVALKVLHVDVSDRRAQRRFNRERALNGRLSNHPNVVTVLDSGFVDGRYPYLAMEHFEHGSLADRIAERGPLGVDLTLHVGVRIAGALESAHALGVLHRDVKPQNVLLSRYGEPALADFGIATILELEHSLTGALTPVHAAPEILEGGDPTPGADVYALGSTIYTLLAGRPPFAGPDGEGMLAQLLRITTSDLPAMPRRDVPADLVVLLRHATAKHLEQRIGSAADLGRSLQSIQAELGLSVTSLPVADPGELMRGRVEPPAPSPTLAAADSSETPVGESDPEPIPSIAKTPRPLDPPDHAWAAGAAPAPSGEEDTVGQATDTPTVIGRQQYPQQTIPPRRRRRWPMIAAVAISCALLAAAAVAVLDPGDDGETQPTAPGVTTGTSSAGATIPPDVSRYVPTDVAASIEAGTLLLTWVDHTGGDAPQLVFVYREGADVVTQAVERGATTVVVDGVRPGAPACFVVAAVMRLGDTDRPTITADSDPECINGATPAVTPPATTVPVATTP
jgi:serine/threonine-protein kinase PknK